MQEPITPPAAERRQFHVRRQEDYDRCVKLDRKEYSCYSHKKMQELYPERGYRVLGETRSSSAASRDAARARRAARKKNGEVADAHVIRPIGTLKIEGATVDIVRNGTNHHVLYKKAGYVCVGEDEFLMLITSRKPFLLLLGALLGLFALTLTLLLALPSILAPEIPPDHPLPEKDANVLPVKGDSGEKIQSEEGGGAVSMIYTLKAELDLSDGIIDMYFVNPGASNQDVVLQLWLTSGGEETLIATSGRIPSGTGLLKMEFDRQAAKLTEGVYTGLYRLACYNPETGERATVSPEIAGVELTVLEGAK